MWLTLYSGDIGDSLAGSRQRMTGRDAAHARPLKRARASRRRHACRLKQKRDRARGGGRPRHAIARDGHTRTQKAWHIAGRVLLWCPASYGLRSSAAQRGRPAQDPKRRRRWQIFCPARLADQEPTRRCARDCRRQFRPGSRCATECREQMPITKVAPGEQTQCSHRCTCLGWLDIEASTGHDTSSGALL
jgi:hypothetical protein